MSQIVIKKGKAIFLGDDLRCAAPRKKDSELTCNKLIVKKNVAGQVAGNFQCGRCKAVIEVELRFSPINNSK